MGCLPDGNRPATGQTETEHVGYRLRRTNAKGFQSFFLSKSAEADVRRYIESQSEHHEKRHFKEELLALLRKNKGKIGSVRIRADLTPRGAVENPTGPMRKLRDTLLQCHGQIRENRAKAAEIDFLIDRIVFRLFDLTLDEQKLILSRVGPGRPLPPRRRKGRKKAKKSGDAGPSLLD